jgi:ppGpp synthetase/RelA/SpoT-type nucleotidyltranferase
MAQKKLVVFFDGKSEEYTQNQFRKRFDLKADFLQNSHLSWNDLVSIAHDYSVLRPKVVEQEIELVNLFQKAMRDNKVNVIHSVRSRTKNPLHLIEKIVRKTDSSENNKRYKKYEQLTVDNYSMFITDLIGVRLLLRYRKDWESLHYFITDEFENKKANYINDYIEDYKSEKDGYIAEKPIAYICVGDANIYPKKIIDHDIGDRYRSIHYIVKFGGFYSEIQTRTVFQEGWSEIDHDNRYPYLLDDRSLNVFSKVFSLISVVADEMSDTFVELREQAQTPKSKKADIKNDEPNTKNSGVAIKDKLVNSNI